MTAAGKRVRKIFLTPQAAEKFAGKLRAAHNTGQRAGMISATLAAQAAEAERILAGTGVSIVEAARMAAAKAGTEVDRETFGDRYDRAMLAREMTWRRRYTVDMERLPRWLPAWFLALPCGTIDRSVIERGVTDGRELARSTLDTRCRYVSAILGFRDRHTKTSSLTILTDDERKGLIAACEGAGERWAVSVLLYAGVRPDAEHGEIARLDWEDFGKHHVTIQPEASKTGSDRLIPITAALRRAIKGHPKSGVVAPAGWKRRWARIRKAAGVTAQDVTRHTFASHFLAAFGEDATKNALGHTAGSSTLFRHYRRAVTEAAGKAYFE